MNPQMYCVVVEYSIPTAQSLEARQDVWSETFEARDMDDAMNWARDALKRIVPKARIYRVTGKAL